MNRKFLVPFILLFFFISTSSAQSDSPYETSWALDGTWIGVGLGLNGLGFKLIQDKEALTAEELAAISKDDVPGFDRWAAGNYSERADNISYYPFYGSFAVPFIMMLTDEQRPHAGQISVLFIETMATTGALYTITAGAVNRSRPLVYNEDLPDELRSEAGARRSFFAGHTAATASATFFAAKVFSDFNPDSWAKPYVWTAAALVPAWVGYLRLEGGKHFLSDNIVGYGIGALSGILIPELHKKENTEFSFFPTMGAEYQGISMRYTF
ncbi:Membrane-associated phospholipid phosphatase [Salinimicrobium catena]|uniref:Membrane-associated phospholipid phosphatase n=1 Tax=Salinimicrobium catena TaxID=390640 RepID=A0A1H5LWG7_9FLAO|nr:phosphatase PAP2 family protein [Salinimicrobium catena]SDL15404.1 Membrane-associated phospholipid phosphatase [Salinimicrobium catena]SEE81379.1 Membrane-associated phospholipid phosphatase [Salinimicrobium catena]